MKRGEIWTVAGGVYPSKVRPAVIVQEDLFSETATVTTVRRSSVQTRDDRLAPDQLAEVQRALMTFVGLAR